MTTPLLIATSPTSVTDSSRSSVGLGRGAGNRSSSDDDVDRWACATMKLPATEAAARLAAHDHGTLCTVHPDRGVDAIPCVYAVLDDHVGVPIDRVKPKRNGRLQRERNLAADPRATLLVERWDREDWSRLWWVRAELRWQPGATGQRTAALGARLAERFTQYEGEPFDRMLVLRIVGVTGWAAAG